MRWNEHHRENGGNRELFEDLFFSVVSVTSVVQFTTSKYKRLGGGNRGLSEDVSSLFSLFPPWFNSQPRNTRDLAEETENYLKIFFLCCLCSLRGSIHNLEIQETWRR
jgi:hypothetical protein